MNDPNAASQRATPRARRIARELGLEIGSVPSRGGLIQASEVMANLADTVSATPKVEVSFPLTSSQHLIAQLAANTLRGEAAPTLGDLFIKAVQASLELHPLPRTQDRQPLAEMYGLYTFSSTRCVIVPDLAAMDLRQIAHVTADLVSGGFASPAASPRVIIADSMRWGLTNLEMDLPPKADLLCTLVADLAAADSAGTIRMQFRTPIVPAELALQLTQMLAELMLDVEWSLH